MFLELSLSLFYHRRIKGETEQYVEAQAQEFTISPLSPLLIKASHTSTPLSEGTERPAPSLDGKDYKIILLRDIHIRMRLVCGCYVIFYRCEHGRKHLVRNRFSCKSPSSFCSTKKKVP